MIALSTYSGAVVPWQVYPIMALIKELDDMEREGRRYV